MHTQVKPDRLVVDACVADVLASTTFSRSERLREFLRYVVEKEQNGEAAQLKGYSIGVDVFRRPESFDPGSDPLVRVQAGKLRKLLELYYQNEGGDAPVRISMPRGGYVPEYSLQHRTEHGDTPRPAYAAKRAKPAWLPAPVSSHFALFSLIPLLLLTPVSGTSLMPLSSLGTAHFAVETESPRRIGANLPQVAIVYPAAATAVEMQMAETLGETLRLFPSIELAAAPNAEPLSFTLSLEEWNDDEARPLGPLGLLVTLTHVATGEAIYAEFVRTATLKTEADYQFESLDFAAKSMAVDGRIFAFAERVGIQTPLMQCMATTDRHRRIRTRASFLELSRCQQSITAQDGESVLTLDADVLPSMAERHTPLVGDEKGT